MVLSHAQLLVKTLSNLQLYVTNFVKALHKVHRRLLGTPRSPEEQIAGDLSGNRVRDNGKGAACSPESEGSVGRPGADGCSTNRGLFIASRQNVNAVSACRNI